MEEDEGGIRLSKRFSDNSGEVDYKTKAGTAWSHSYLNQKPWHPLSYPNQRRKWIAEQTHAQRERRAEELAREYAQEREFLRQTSLLSQKEKEKVDMMQAVSFMYVRPPGYNAESAKAAEIADERKKLGENDPTTVASSSLVLQQTAPVKEEKKKPQPRDVFGRPLPTEEEFAVLKNAPRLETGVPGRVKPFAVEVRNVKCVRCGNFGHQSGDRECPLKDAIMPNDENRLKRDDPLTAIMAHMDSSEPLKWELKQRPGISSPRGGFMPDDPNQQIVAEDIFDEYGGFLTGGGIPELLTDFSSAKHKRKKSENKGKHNRQSPSRQSHDSDSSESGDHRRTSKTKSRSKSKRKKQPCPAPSVERDDYCSEEDRHQRRSRRKPQLDKNKKNKKKDCSHSSISGDSESERHHGKKLASPARSSREKYSALGDDKYQRRLNREELVHKSKRKGKDWSCSSSSEDSDGRRPHQTSKYKHSHGTECHDSEKLRQDGSPSHLESRASYKRGLFESERKPTRKGKTHRSRRTIEDNSEFSSEDSELQKRNHKGKNKHSYASEKFNWGDRV